MINLNIKKVEELLKLFPKSFLPKHIILINEPITESFSHQKINYTRLSPKWRKDTIIITNLGNGETVYHEWAHCILGLGEFGAKILGKFFDRISCFSKVRRATFTYELAESPDPRLKQYILKDGY